MKKHYILLITLLLLSSIGYSQIFITEIGDPTEGSDCRFIELYNFGNSSVDLGSGNYRLQRYTNADTTASSNDVDLTGTIAAKGFYTIGVAEFNTCYGFTPSQTIASTTFFSNGDDQIELLDGSDTVLDIFGVIGTDGTNECHDFEDGRAERIASVTTGVATWNEAEWNVTGDSAVAGCTSHTNGTLAASSGAFDPGAWIGAPVTDTVVEFVSVDSSVSENTASIDICVSITNESGSTATTVELNLDGASTTTNGSDYSSITFPTTLTFPAGSSTNQCLTINITNDATTELDETVILNLQNPSGGSSAELGILTQHTLTILANDLDIPNVGDILITELMQNPNVTGDADGEYFEVYNKTANPIDMNGWKLADHNSDVSLSNAIGTTIVPANGYLVFAVNDDSTENGNIPQVDYNLAGTDIILANSNGRIILTAESTEIDRVEWLGDGSDNFPVPNGASMELSTTTYDGVLNNNGSNWGLAITAYGDGDFGTPRTINDFSRSVSVSDGNWSETSTWINSVIPISTTDVVIAHNVVLNQNYTAKSLVINTSQSLNLNIERGLTINGNFSNNGTLTAQSGSSLLVSGTSTGNITYNLAIPDTNWHLVSSPVVGETYNDAWMTANGIATGTEAANRGISTYDNDTDANGDWVYFQTGGTETTFTSGAGYSLLRTGSGNYSFTGTVPTTDVSTSISRGFSGNNRWNLVGNPFPSYIDVTAFLTANAAALTDTNEAVYIWNGTIYQEITTGFIHPGQAFFVNAENVGATNITVTEAMLSGQTGTAFLKNNNPSIALSIENGTTKKETTINYLADKTTGLDPRFDVGRFTGSSNNGTAGSFEVFTQLVENNEGVDFVRQTLPNSNFESMVVPVGITADAGKEITFTADAQNLPSGINVYLEDRQLNTFTRLDEANANYKVTLTDASNGAGRFYMHTASKALSTDSEILGSVSIYKTNNSNLRIAGLQNGNASVKIFNILGKKVLQKSFTANGPENITLPNLASGIYIVQLQNEAGSLSKKIILE